MKFAAIVLLALPLLASATLCNYGPELLGNGGFESPALGGNSQSPIPASGFSWTVTGGSGCQLQNTIAGLGPEKEGQQHVLLACELSQDMPTVNGWDYTVYFNFAAVPGAADAEFIFAVDGHVIFDEHIDGSRDRNLVWRDKSHTFWATGPHHTISVSGRNVVVDKISGKSCGAPCYCTETTYTGRDCTDAPVQAHSDTACVCAKFVKDRDACRPSTAQHLCPDQ